MKIPFVKMHGNGNDFVIIDDINQRINKQKNIIKKITHRRTGVGCDQLIFMEKSSTCDIFMRIYNSDGTEAEMCGNAARCIASLLMAGEKKDNLTIETASCILKARLEKNNEIQISMNLPKQDLNGIVYNGYKSIINLESIHPCLNQGYVINMGNPHIVFFTKSLDLIDLKQVGHDIETYKAFKKGVNIEVAQITSKSSLSLKFWERGAGETLSCGSGILAACFASFKNKQCSNSIKVALPIGSVSVNINNAQISITGKAEVSYLGEYHYA